MGFPGYGAIHNPAFVRIIRLRFTPDEGWQIAA